MFRKSQPKQPAQRKRRRTSCGNCSTQYCVRCKQVWHEGDCKPLTDAIKKEEKVSSTSVKHTFVVPYS